MEKTPIYYESVEAVISYQQYNNTEVDLRIVYTAYFLEEPF